jgi:hypothetical protein
MQEFLITQEAPQVNKLLRMGAVVALSLTLTVSALAGILHSPGKADPLPPPPGETNTPPSTDLATTIILTIISTLP